jgi:hypothetical protein
MSPGIGLTAFRQNVDNGTDIMEKVDLLMLFGEPETLIGKQMLVDYQRYTP